MAIIENSTAMNLHEFMEFQADMTLEQNQVDAGYANSLFDIVMDRHNPVTEDVPMDRWCFTLEAWEDADNQLSHGNY